MKIDKLMTAEEFCIKVGGNHTKFQLMQMYAKHVATVFTAECVNYAIGRNVPVGESVRFATEEWYKNIEWPNADAIKHMKIGSTDIFLEEKGDGKGKITISDTGHGSFSYYWGSMGGTLEEFLGRIDDCYFAMKLCSVQYQFSLKGSLKNLRASISDEFQWWEDMPGQKALRKEINNYLSDCENEHEWVAKCNWVFENLSIDDYDTSQEREFKSRISHIFSEPWHYIDKDSSDEYKWLIALHKSIKQNLKNS